MRRLISAMFIVSAIMIAACSSPVPNKENPTKSGGPGLAPTEESLIDRDLEWRIEFARKSLGLSKPSTEAVSNETKPQGQNDVLCYAFIANRDVYDVLLDASGKYSAGTRQPFTADDWAKVGVTEQEVEAKSRDTAQAFLKLLAPIVVKSKPEREKLEASWNHTCDGMLRPAELDHLIDEASQVVRDSKVDIANVDAMMRRAAVTNYRERLAAVDKQDQAGREQYENGVVTLELARVWGSDRELGVTSEFADKYKGEGKQ